MDLNKYRNDSKDVFYGLPQDIKYCKTCVMSNQKPNSDIEHNNNADRKKKTPLSQHVSNVKIGEGNTFFSIFSCHCERP